MLVIRLTRVGKKNSPSYRVVVADKKRAVKRKFIEIIGNYNPTLMPKQLVIDKERALFWVEKGAQPSDTVNNLMVNLGILAKEKRITKVYGKKLTKKEIKEGPAPATETEETPKTEVTDENAEAVAVTPEETKEEAEPEAKDEETIPDAKEEASETDSK